MEKRNETAFRLYQALSDACMELAFDGDACRKCAFRKTGNCEGETGTTCRFLELKDLTEKLSAETDRDEN